MKPKAGIEPLDAGIIQPVVLVYKQLGEKFIIRENLVKSSEWGIGSPPVIKGQVGYQST